MPIKVTCSCGATAMVKDEYAGRTGECRTCKAPIVVGQPPVLDAVAIPAAPTLDFTQPTVERMAPEPPRVKPSSPASDTTFSRDIFLLRQKHLAINEKYAVWDENGSDLLFIERPAHLLRNLLALFGGLTAGGAMFALFGFTFQGMPQAVQVGYLLFGSLIAVIVIIAVYVRLEQKRHVEFYRDESRRTKVLRVIQDKKFEIITATFTVTDAAGKVVGTFRKNYLYDLLRKKWECRDLHGNLLFIAREDSVIKSLLRRLLGPLFGLLRVNFIFCEPVNGEVVGMFNRSFTILDRYVLDMTQDNGQRIDRRLALAIGVLLDTGERR